MGSAMLCVVIPVYNEREVIGMLRDRLGPVLASLGMPYEVVLVDDGSSDGTTEILRSIPKTDGRWKSLILSRNYGHQFALSAGLDHTAADVVVVLDADLQDPPELIPAMLEKWREGFEVVYGQRRSRAGESWAKRLTADLFYRLIRSLSGSNIPRDAGDFRLMDRKVVDALKRMPEHSRFVRGLVAWTGFRQCPILFDRPARAAGQTKYPWRKMFLFALDAIFAFSVVPLRIATFCGALIMFLAGCETMRILYLRFILNAVIPGFTPLFISTLLLGGLNLTVLGIIGEYIGRIYQDVRGRPRYVIREPS